MQTSVTIGRKVTENINIIQYLILRTLKIKMQLFILSIAKSIDSIDRYQLLIYSYKIHPKIINIIADTYNNYDKTSE